MYAANFRPVPTEQVPSRLAFSLFIPLFWRYETGVPLLEEIFAYKVCRRIAKRIAHRARRKAKNNKK